jgi:hypothetical protein
MSDRCGARFPQLPNYFAASPSSISLQSGPPRRDAAVRDEPNHSKRLAHNHAMILPFHANPRRMELLERTGIKGD